MSKPVEPFEISALIDGELEPERAAEVRAALEQDPLLRAQLERLGQVDRTWTLAARSAQFTPLIPRHTLEASPRRARLWWMAAMTVLMVLGRCTTKLASLELPAAMLIHALMLAAAMAALVWLTTHTGPEQDTPLPTAR